LAYAGRKALIKVGGNPVSMLDEPTTNTVTNLEYQITNTSKRIIDMNSSITVEVGGVAVSSGYTVNTLTGTVIFDTAAVRTVTVTGYYIPMSTAAECKEWSNTINGEMVDTTAFQADWNSRIQGLKMAEGSLSRWLTVDTYFFDALVSGKPVVIELFAQDTLNPDRMWAIINSTEMSAVIDGANEEAVSFESTNKMLMSYVS
jgi:hypothetical protein